MSFFLPSTLNFLPQSLQGQGISIIFVVESLTFWRTLRSSSLSFKLGFPQLIPLRRRPKILSLNLIKPCILQLFTICEGGDNACPEWIHDAVDGD